MEWRDDGFVLGSRKHGEADVIATLLTRHHGRHLGLVKGGASKAKRPILEPGNLVSVVWRARLSEQLGTVQVEPMRSTSAHFLGDARKLAALAAACAILDAALAEREPHADQFDELAALLEAMTRPEEKWLEAYVRWEAALLAGLGFGLDLSRCALTGATRDLAFVSPRTGRAASREASRGLERKLLPLPRFLLESAAAATKSDIFDGLRLTGHFLHRHVLDQMVRKGPVEARDWLIGLLRRNES